ncbi:class I SAM-dependent methyltransferase [Neobacillus sp. NPDC093182]|uniref:class I SAM-dependent methyltransferase n=1 Tax=Neobacillus sp. NPDC093182 TaxID=3364297 RepID=UPI00381E556F
MEPYPNDYYLYQHEGAEGSAKEIVPYILELIKPNSVVDVGCGSGSWLSIFHKYGVKDILGIDAEVDKNILKIPKEKFMACDLKSPIDVNRQFDLVVSLEVAEHLPIESGRNFIDFLTRLGPVILFSAAIPYQGGYGHLNEQWPEFWARYFLKNGYEVIDCIRKKIWNKNNVEWWYAQNLLLFVKKEYIETLPELKKEYTNTHISQLSLVHPRQYLALHKTRNQNNE